jgi:hypothetical protein
MIFPAWLADIDGISRFRSHWGSAITASVTSILVVVSLIDMQLVLQVRRGPEEGVIQ